MEESDNIISKTTSSKLPLRVKLQILANIAKDPKCNANDRIKAILAHGELSGDQGMGSIKYELRVELSGQKT